MYFAGGTIVKSRLPNSSSVFYNNIPNREFWFDLPSLCKDGFVFALSGGKKKGGDEHDDFNKDPDVLDRAPVNVLPLSTPLLAPLVCVMRTTHGGDGCRSSFLLLSASPAQLRSHSELTHSLCALVVDIGVCLRGHLYVGLEATAHSKQTWGQRWQRRLQQAVSEVQAEAEIQEESNLLLG